MSDAANVIQQVIILNGGQLVGKTRLQKSMYLLETFQAGFGFNFDYHYYGPYSEEVSSAASDAVALKYIVETPEVANNGLEYKVFKMEGKSDAAEAPLDKRRREILKILDGYSSVELELAATAEFLSRNGFPKNAWEETGRRKATKINKERKLRAEEVLAKLYALPKVA